MITVDDARSLLLDLVAPLPTERVDLVASAGRTLSEDLAARRDQPPFAASAMDGYAMKSAEVELHAMFKVIGEAAAGHGFDGVVGPGQAVRIFTGAPVPEGADFVVIQEDISRTGDLITIRDEPGSSSNIRAKGGDFRVGTTVDAPKRLRAEDVALLAAMNCDTVPVTRRPVVALISTGDELVMPGDTPSPDQIIASNTFGLKAMLEQAGAEVRMLPIARDTEASLTTAFSLADGADLVVTIGGASVGDHDLVGKVAQDLGILSQHSTDRLLTEWRYNAKLGANYLAGLAATFDGNVVMMSAGYNAGPGRPIRWMELYGDPRDGGQDIVDWIEHIPFNETRNYVMRVTESLPIYRARLGQPALPIPFSEELTGSTLRMFAP